MLTEYEIIIDQFELTEKSLRFLSARGEPERF